MRYELAVFDMDGTILDTLKDLTISINHALKENGFPVHTIEEVRFFVGNGIDKLIERAAPVGITEREHLAIRKSFMEHYGIHSADNTDAYPGVRELLQKLKAAGVKTAVVSNKPDPAVKVLADKYFHGLFLTAVGAREGFEVKPAPDMCLSVFEELGAGPENAVYIGDSDTDIMTARNAGLDEILVSWGFRGRGFLEEHGAKTICDTADEVYDMIVSK